MKYIYLSSLMIALSAFFLIGCENAEYKAQSNSLYITAVSYTHLMDGEICFVRSKTSRTTKHNKEIHAIITPEMWRCV